MTFHVGQKVVAIEFESEYSPDVSATEFRIGSVYTIRDIDMRTVPLYGVPTLRLEEIINRSILVLSIGDYWELGYDPRAFRPIVERETDISIFQSMLTKQTEKV